MFHENFGAFLEAIANYFFLVIFQIDTLSKMNHKNFVNLIGYCEEEKPFTRRLVFEYAPHGTLFEHLHSEFMNLHSGSISCLVSIKLK